MIMYNEHIFCHCVVIFVFANEKKILKEIEL